MVKKNRTALGLDIEAGLKEIKAHREGKISLESRVIEEMPAGRVKEIRKKVAKSTKDFEQRFGVPARTVEGWEQGKRVDLTGRVLLRVIERDPEAVERALCA
jgi:putative transcriptional regulator